MATFAADTSLLRAYSEARLRFLSLLGCNDSCRDPLAEFSERLVCQLLGGKLADSRVQKGFDLTTTDGRRVQVKYLANPGGTWRNEHKVSFQDNLDDYAVAFFGAFELCAVIVFSRENLRALCAALGKKHPDQDRTLQITQANFRKLLSNAAEFERLGVRIFVP